MINYDNVGFGDAEALAFSVYNNASYHFHMECGFTNATTFRIASMTSVGWTMRTVYVVGVWEK